MFMTMFRMKTRFAAWAAMLAIILVMPLTLPTPARAAGTTNWRCNTRADQPQTRTLSGSDLARPSTDRRVYDLDCSFTATAPGPSPVTLCVSAPEGENAGGPLRRLKRRDGNEMISYRLTAQTGDVRGAVSFPIAELRPTLQPLYTVPIPHGDAGSDGSFRHQLALITEFQGDAGRLLSEGEYNDTLTGLVVSIHEGTDCGLLLWGPPADSLGAAANFTSALRVPGSCNFSTVVNINFGTVTDLLTLPQANGSVRIICTPSAGAITLTANGGTHVNFFFHRNMQILAPPPGVNNFISYDLFKPDGTLFYTTDSISLAGSATVVIAGKVLGNGGAFPRAGDYTDSVILTLTY